MKQQHELACKIGFFCYSHNCLIGLLQITDISLTIETYICELPTRYRIKLLFFMKAANHSSLNTVSVVESWDPKGLT